MANGGSSKAFFGSGPGQVGTFDVLSGASAGFQALSSIIAANEKAEQKKFQLEQQRLDQELQADVDREKAQQKQEKINDRLDNVLAQQEAIQSASGTDVGSGSNQAVRKNSIENAQEAKQRVATNLALGQLSRQSRIDQLAINEEFKPDQIESQGRISALQGLSSFAAQTGLRKRREKQREKQIAPKDVRTDLGGA